MTARKKADPIQEIVTQARRAQILSAAAQVFAERGYHRATIRQVAERAGVADGTIYNYFANKADLLLGILNQVDTMERGEEQFMGLSHTDFRETFMALQQRRLALYLANMPMFQAILPEMLVDPALRQHYFEQNVAPTLKHLEQHLAARAAEGHIRPVNYPLTARAMTALHIGLLVLHLLGDQALAEQTEAWPEALGSLLYDGLKPAERTIERKEQK